MDNGYFLDDTDSLLAANYTPISVHTFAVNELDERIDVLESNDSAQGALITGLNVTVSNLKNKPGNNDGFPWDQVYGPILDGATDVLGELLQWWLSNQSFKDFLADFLAKSVGTAPGIDVDLDDDNILDMPDVPVDFRRLACNCFAIDRSVSQSNAQNWGVTCDRDFNVLSGKRFNIIDPAVLATTSPFGAAYNTLLMTTGAKYPVMDFTSNKIDLNFKTGTFSNTLTTSNLFGSNATFSDLYSNKIGGTTITGSTVSGTVVNSAQFAGSNVTIYQKDDFVDGVTNTTAVIKSDGSASFRALSVNKNNFEIKSDGSVHVNGLMVITSAGKVLVHDDDVIASSHRYNLDDMLSGNIGSSDTYGFSKDVALWDTAETAAPLNMANVTNDDDMLKILCGEMRESITESVDSTISRASSVSGVSDFKRVYSLDDTEDDAWEIDLVTGKVINAPPVIESPGLELVRTDSFSDIFNAEIVNAPLHCPELNVMKSWVAANDPLTFDAYDDQAFPDTNLWLDEDAYPTSVEVLDEKTSNLMKIFESYFDNRRRATTYLGIDEGDMIDLGELPDPPNFVEENGFSFDKLPMRFPTTIFSDETFQFDTRPQASMNPVFWPQLLRFDSDAF